IGLRGLGRKIALIHKKYG
nr:Chain A, Cathelicidin-5 [Bos taurus]